MGDHEAPGVLIDRIRVQGYKSLLDVEVELGQVNVFVGANGSGKSSLLEAVAILGAAAYGRVDESQLRDRGVRAGEGHHYLTQLWDVPSPTAASLEATCSTPAEACYGADLIPSGTAAWMYSRETWTEGDRDLLAPNGSSARDRGLASLKAAEAPPGSPALALLSRLERFRIYTPVTEVMRDNQNDIREQYPVGLQGDRLGVARYEAMQHALQAARWVHPFPLEPGSGLTCGPEPESLAFRDPQMPRTDVNATLRIGTELAPAEVAEGPLYTAFLEALLYHPNAPDMWAVENFEHALNPRMVESVLRWLCEVVLERPGPPKQVLLTTHNPAALDGLNLSDDRIRLFTVGRSSKGRTIVRHLDFGERVEEWRKKDMPLSRLWVLGELGGVPSV